MARSKSSKRWLAEHFDDEFVRLAQQQGLRSRSAFKLQELDEKYRLIRPGMVVVDLGAAPGGWCQVVQHLLAGSGRLVALDILDMDPLPGVEFIQGDFTEDEPLARLEAILGGQKADLVLSDMAPNMSGMAAIDQAKAMYLAELAMHFALEHLKPGGDFVVKLFQGTDFDGFVREARKAFRNVLIKKPRASRPRSREVYLLARGYQVE
ncbi:MAG: 23S rRNA (uridine(2552)-2'-O)-methyltransferase RlmE [Lysobacterales bacterium]|jgi:23S rRNA (uridine2552-2'-O)-methyltransferase